MKHSNRNRRVRPGPAATPARQRGAIGLLSAAVVLLALMALMLALDTGRLMLEKRRLQQQADLAALAAAQRYCDGFADAAAVRDEVLESLDDNGFAAGAPADVDIAIGDTVAQDRLRRFAEGGASRAARVRLRKAVPASLFAGGLAGGEVTLQAEATAQRDLIGALAVGTRLASLDSTQSQLLQPLLGSLLGAAVSLDAMSYAGLANANIPLRLLRDALGEAGVIADVGTLEDLVDAELGFGVFLDVMARALSANGDSAALALQTLQAQVAAGARAATTLQLADILLVETGYPNADQALGASVNALDLLMAGAMAVNRNHLLTIPNLSVSTAANPLLSSLVGNLLTTTLRLRVIEPPAIAVGRFGFDENGDPRTRARSAQLEAALAVHLAITPADGGLVGPLLNLIATVSGDIAIGITAAGGSGWLDHVDRCPTLLSRDFRFVVGTSTEVASLRIGHPADTATPASLKVGVNLLGLGSIAELDATVGTGSRPLLGGESSLAFDIDLAAPDSLPTPPRSVGTDLSDAVGGLSGWKVTSGASRLCTLGGLICLPLPLLDFTGGLIGVLGPVLGAVAELVLEPVLKLLGVSIGEVDVRLLGAEEGHGALLI